MPAFVGNPFKAYFPSIARFMAVLYFVFFFDFFSGDLYLFGSFKQHG